MTLQRGGLLLLALCLLLPVTGILAQDGSGDQSPVVFLDPPPANEPPDDVYVTTQDLSSLRKGPGLHFDRITVLDPAVTLHAVGRTSNTNWIQVDYNGQRGWVATWLLVWSGDIVQLPVDGVDPSAFIRRIGVSGITTRETPLYAREVVGADRIGTLPGGTPVELTGRLGDRGMFRYQILYEGQLYWVGSWDIRVTGGNYRAVFDTAYLFPYGRLVSALSADINTVNRRLSAIEDIWRQLESGHGVHCAYLPAYVNRRTTDTDVAYEPQFAPAVQAFDAASLRINAAISAFEDACTRAAEGVYLTQDTLDDALTDVAEGRRYLVVSSSLLTSLSSHNPLLNQD